MGREERRKQQRAEKKINDKKVEAIRWFRSLPPEKAELVQSYARMMAEKHSTQFTGALDRAYTATLIKCFDYLEWHHIEKVIEVFDEFVEEDVKKMQEITKKCGGDLEMAAKKINAQEMKVRDRASELIREGKKQKDVIEILTGEFSMLSKSMLTNVYKKTKTMMQEADEMKKGIEKALDIKEVVNKLGDPDVETDKALEYIFGEEKVDDVKVETIEVPKIEAPAETQEAEFEIIKEVRILDLKGKFAEYHIEKNVVEVIGQKLAFCNEDEVTDWANEEKNEIWNKIEELQNKINLIADREKETIKVIKKFM